jgi:hypothetical protein
MNYLLGRIIAKDIFIHLIISNVNSFFGAFYVSHVWMLGK